MKRKSTILIGLLMLSGLFIMQGCNKEDDVTIKVQNTYSVPKAAAPIDGATIAPTTSTVITWEATGGAADSWDVYFGDSEDNMVKIATGHASQSITVNNLVEGTTYYWGVECVDANGIVTTSPNYHFTVKVSVNIDNFVGTYDCDEPGYAHYDVVATKVNATTILIDNFWDSGWPLEYTFDDMGNVTIVTKVFQTSASTTYTVEGEGTYNNTTGGFVVDYVVTKKVYTFTIADGVKVVTTTADSNTHTFVKK